MILEQNIIKTILLLILFTLGINQVKAQGLRASDSLYKEIAKADSTLFNAFNNRDMETFKKMFTTDLEFFHDKGGLTDYNYTVESFKRTIAQNNDLRRDLVIGSLEVYPIKDYGAIQVASHTFCHTENGRPDCGTFKFLHIWKKINGEWKITRVVSYNH
jgi:ketosteroid isomerase-like protein